MSPQIGGIQFGQIQHWWHPRKKQMGMVIDLRRCTGCYACQIACKAENEVAPGRWRNHLRIYERGKYPNTRTYFLLLICNHCRKPACVRVCPVGALYKREDGMVLRDYTRCIGCRYCMNACPYGTNYINPVTRTADKCTFCVHRVDLGIVPACVNACPTRARIWGDIYDPESEVSKLIATNPVTVLKPDQGTFPSVFYIGLSVPGTQVEQKLEEETEVL